MSPGRYEITCEIARGGLGRILSAKDRLLKREVAIKECLTGDPAAAERFVREVLITARLQHPAIVPVYEAGRWPDGASFYAMKLVAGRSLDQVIQGARTLDERLVLLPHILAMVEAIAYAHHNGVIHRDLKPANVLIGTFGETVVIDWGIAKEVTGEPPEVAVTHALPAEATPAVPSGLTVAGTVVGTPEYMAPEQVRGDALDARADVYGLGAVLYQLLGGLPPYEGSTPRAVLMQVAAGPPVPLRQRQRGIPRDLLAVVDKAMARDREDRYPSAAELAQDLRRFLTGQLVAAHAYSAQERLVHWLRRHRAPAAVAALGLALLGLVSGLGVRRIIKERDVAQAARRQVERRTYELTLMQAQAALEHDPTAALAWLKLHPPGGPEQDAVYAVAAEAWGRGVARHVLRGHTRGVAHAAFSPDGRWIASAGGDGAVWLWDAQSGVGRRLGGHPAPVGHVSFSPDGATLASAGLDGTIRLWGVRRGAQRVLTGHQGRVRVVRFTADGARLVSAGDDGTVRLWSVDGGVGRVLLGHDSDVLCLVLSPDGRHAASGGRDHSVRLWDLDSGAGRLLAAPALAEEGRRAGRSRRAPGRAPAHADPGHSDVVADLAFSPDGATLASASHDRTVRLWDVHGGSHVLAGHLALVRRVAFSPDGRLLASGSDDNMVRLWDVQGGTSRVLAGHAGTVVSLVFSPDGTTLASGSRDHTVRLWDVHSGASRVLSGHQNTVTHVALSPDGGWLLSASSDRSLRLWRVGGQEGRLLRGHSDQVAHLAFSPDGATLATAGRDRAVRLWRLDAWGAARALSGHTDTVRRLAFSPDGRLLASASLDDTVGLWDVSTGAGRFLGGHGSDVMAVAFSPDGRTVASASVDRTLRLFDVKTGGVRVLTGHRGGVWTLAYAPDARTLASAGLDREVRIWDVAGSGSDALIGHQGSIDAVLFSPDGRRLASASADCSVRLWDLQTHQALVLSGHEEPVGTLAFAPDGGSLASGAEDGTVRLWRVLDGIGRVLGTHGRDSAVASVAFSPDGALLASGGRDGTVRIFQLSSGGVRVLRLGGPVRAVSFSPNGQLLAAAGDDATVRLWPVQDLAGLPREPQALGAWIEGATSAAIGAHGEVEGWRSVHEHSSAE